MVPHRAEEDLIQYYGSRITVPPNSKEYWIISNTISMQAQKTKHKNNLLELLNFTDQGITLRHRQVDSCGYSRVVKTGNAVPEAVRIQLIHSRKL